MIFFTKKDGISQSKSLKAKKGTPPWMNGLPKYWYKTLVAPKWAMGIVNSLPKHWYKLWSPHSMQIVWYVMGGKGGYGGNSGQYIPHNLHWVGRPKFYINTLEDHSSGGRAFFSLNAFWLRYAIFFVKKK